MSERKITDETILDEYLHYRKEEIIREISEDDHIVNQEVEICPYGFEYSEAPGCADVWDFQLFGEGCLFCPFAKRDENKYSLTSKAFS